MSATEPKVSPWKAAVGDLAEFVPSDYRKRYAAALNELAVKISPHLWDCHGGIWEKPSGDSERTALSLAHLSRLLVETCEEYRALPKPEGAAPKQRRLSARERTSYAKAADQVAKLFESGARDLVSILLSRHDLVRSGPAAFLQSPSGLSASTRRRFDYIQDRNISSHAVAAFMRHISSTLRETDYRKTAAPPSKDETQLWLDLVTWLRVATGARWHYQTELPAREPTGGKPLLGVVLAFSEAAGVAGTADKPITERLIKARLEARKHA